MLIANVNSNTFEPGSGTIVTSDLLIEGYHSDCNNHYQSAAYALSPKYPRICIYGKFISNSTCLNWVECYEHFGRIINMYNPKFVGYINIGDYPPTTSDNYASVKITTNYHDQKYSAKLIKCRIFEPFGYCYVHGQCNGINNCLKQLSTLITNTSWYSVPSNLVIGLSLIE